MFMNLGVGPGLKLCELGLKIKIIFIAGDS